MTAATLAAAPIRDTRSVPQIGERAATRAAPEAPATPFKDALCEATKPNPREKPTEDALSGQGSPANADKAESPEAQEEASYGEVPAEETNEAQDEHAAGADVAPEAQNEAVPIDDGARRDTGADDAGTVTENEPRGHPATAAASPGGSAAPEAAGEHATGSSAFQAGPVSPPGAPAVLDAPPTVHRVNDLLLTLDPRALQAAGVQSRGHAPLPGDSTSATANTQARLSTPYHAHPFARDPHLPFGEAPASEPDHADKARQIPRSADPLTAANHPEPRPHSAQVSASDPAANSASRPDAGAQPTAAAAGATAPSARHQEALTRMDASLRALSRLAGSPVKAVDTPAANTSGAGTHGGPTGRDTSPTLAKAAPARPQMHDAAPRTEHTFQAQLSRGLAAAIAQRGGRVTLRLTPQALGELKIDMTVKDGAVSARFEAATSEARELLGKSMEHLREVLHAKGLHVERLEVREHAAEPRPTTSDAEQRPDADAGARPRDEDGREDPGERGSQERRLGDSPPGSWTGDAAEAASELIGGSPEDQVGAAWRFGVDAIA